MRKKGLVERILMKAPASEDFSASILPKNRGQLFLYMIQNKFFKIYKNHICMAVFFIPLAAWGIMTMRYTDMVFSLDPREGITHLVEYWFTVYVTAIPLWVLAFVGLAGGLNVIRKLAWSDPVVQRQDFVKGIKDSGRQLALVGLLWGIAYAIIRYAIDWLGFYYRVFDDSYSTVFGIIMLYFVLFVLICLTVYMSCMSSLYMVSVKELFVGSFKIYFADFFLATGVIMLSLLPFLVLFSIGLAITTLIAYLLTICIFIGVMTVPMLLVCHHGFDRIINKRDYPDYYARGLSYGVNPETRTEMIGSDRPMDDKIFEIEKDFERVNDDED